MAATELADGDVVCVRLDGSLAVRRLSRLPQGPVLECAAAGAAAAVPLSAAAVHGRVTGLIRRLSAVAAGDGPLPMSVSV
jgi:hypothetical protein